MNYRLLAVIVGIILFALLKNIIFKIPSFIYWKYQDYKHIKKFGKGFQEYGLRMFCGRQGGGKTVGMIYTLEHFRKKYPKLKIYTNIDYKYQDDQLRSWEDLLNPELRNGEDGVVFAIDEIQNEFSSAAWKDFPESILSEITQQRKQRICILATSQIFTRVAKPLREQCYQVIECFTLLGRWTFLKCYDAEDYNMVVDSNDPEKKLKVRKLWKENFIQTDELRNLFDSYAKVNRMLKIGFNPKQTN